jgi:tetratricopeptide (TPR) repeat protein
MNFKAMTCLLGLLAALFLVSQASMAQGKGKKKSPKKEQADKAAAKETGKTKPDAAATETEKEKETGKKGKEKKAEKGKEGKEEKGAAGAKPAPTGDPKELAKSAYKQGKELYDKGDYEKSLESFMAAYNYMPNPFVYISIAQCYDKLGKCQEARDYYLKYIQEKPDAGNIPDIKEKVAELEARKGKVSVISDPDGAVVTIDGETTDLKTPAKTELKGGDHALALSMDGYIMETRAFTVPICGEVEISVKMNSATPGEIKPTEDIGKVVKEVKEEKKPKRKIKLGAPHYVAFSLAGAAAITAAVTGGLAIKKSNDFSDKKAEYDRTLSPAAYSELEDIKSQGRPLAIVCDVSIGVAAVAAVTGIALLFIGPKESKEVSVSPIISAQGGGASLNMNF